MQIEDRDLYQLLLAEFRYAVARDNHLAPSTCAEHVKSYLPDMEKRWRSHTAEQLTSEIFDERLWHSKYLDPEFKFESNVYSTLTLAEPKNQLSEDYLWEDLLKFLTNYIEKLPHNVNKYMEHIKDKMTYSKGIDYYSTEMQDKLIENAKRK